MDCTAFLPYGQISNFVWSFITHISFWVSNHVLGGTIILVKNFEEDSENMQLIDTCHRVFDSYIPQSLQSRLSGTGKSVIYSKTPL